MPLPPAEKLSLALRKNVRDEWENKKAEFEKKLSDLTGASWTIDINPLAIWPYHNDGYAKDSLGSCIASYVDGAIDQIKYYESQYGEEGIKELNAIASAHVLTMDVDESGKFSYCGGIIRDGKLVIVFNEKSLGTNISYALETKVLLDALNNAPAPEGSDSKLSFAARTSIRQEWEPKAEELRKQVADVLQNPDIKFSPNFEGQFEVLAAERKRKGTSLSEDWERSIGQYTFYYYESVLSYLKYGKFDEDDMLQEGFKEVVNKNDIAFRIVDKLEYDSYGEVVVKDGVLYIQCLPTTWGTNTSYAAQKILDQL